MSSAANADRNLLFGMFALQNDHVTQDQLIEAFQLWILRKDRPLDAFIREKGWMTGADVDSLNALLDRRAAKAGGQRQLLEAMPDEAGVLHTLVIAIQDDDLFRTAASVPGFFTRTIRPQALASPEAAEFFKPSDEKDEPRPPSNDPDVTIENPQVVLSQTVEPPNAPGTPQGETRVRFETEFVFNEADDFLGNGAFGDVFRSEDREFQRKVALKRLQKKHMGQGLTPVSFLLEAEINGKLDHPGVLPMYGLGKTPAGVPFYVMKVIDAPNFGKVIDAFHAAEAKPGRDPGDSNQEFRKLLDHLRSVCMTMQYAHDRGVLHCDLKPANIMTGSYGETYVVDWGQALLVNPVEDWDKTRDHAPVNHPLGEIHPDRLAALHDRQGGDRYFIGGTLAYMSPEHWQAHESSNPNNPDATDSLKLMTPACDIFALGVILYQILTGKTPCTAVEGEDKPRQRERARKADYVPPAELKSGVSKALSAICMKALEPEARDRYRSTELMANDLEKWLAGDELRTQRDLAEANRIRAEANEKAALDREKLAIDAVKQFSEAVMSNATLKNDSNLKDVRNDLLKMSIQFFDKLKTVLRTSCDTRTESLNSLAEGLYQHAYLANEIGYDQDARSSFEEAEQIWNKLAAKDLNNSQFRSGQARAQYRLGTLEQKSGRIDFAREAYHNSIKMFSDLEMANPSTCEFITGLALAFSSLGKLEDDCGQTDAARDAYLKAIDAYEKLSKTTPQATDHLRSLASILINLAAMEYDNGSVDSARVAASWAKRIRSQFKNDSRSLPVIQNGIVASLNEVAYLDSDRGRSKFSELISEREPRDLPVSLNGYSWFLASTPGREREAYFRAVGLAEQALIEDPENSLILNTLGVAQYRAEKYAESASTLAKSTELNRSLAGIEFPSDLAFLAMAQWLLGQKTEAEATYSRLAESMKRPEFAADNESCQFFHEATNLIHPMTLPENPFEI